MNSRHCLRYSSCVHCCALLFFVLSSTLAHAQSSAPWSGAVGIGDGSVNQRGMSADGRFVVFDSSYPLVGGDTNSAGDVFLRDRSTGSLQRVSISTSGSEGNGPSAASSISANGRHVVFSSTASLDASDTNGVTDVYVRDLDTGTTSLVTIGPSGQRLNCNCAPLTIGRLNGDGRFVLFSANFGFNGGWLLWLRDRDSDQNGVFDEAGTVTTTGIDLRTVESDSLAAIDSLAISDDARYVAVSAAAVDADNSAIGNRIYLHDRVTGVSTRVDRPVTGMDVVAVSLSPDFGASGLLAYTSTAPNLVAGDSDPFADVFVYDATNGTNMRVSLTHLTATFVEASGVSISADGRFVSFTGVDDAMGVLQWNVYAVDRQLHTSHDISVGIDGSRDNNSTGSAMSSDGSTIAFNGGGHIVQESIFGGVFVATGISIASEITEVPMDGGLVPVEINFPADTFWTASLVSGTAEDFVIYSTYSGTGSGTLDVEIPFNYWGESTAYQLWLGSESIKFEQRVKPILFWLGPDSGPTTGGTPFQITGFGFADGVSVQFDGVAATGILVEEDGTVIYGVTPPHFSNLVQVVLTNPDGASSVEETWFYYYDETPPVVTAAVNGTASANGWYTSDVVIAWQIEETDSELFAEPCASASVLADTASSVFSCFASSGGGDTTEHITIKRDATAPTIAIAVPQSQTYLQGLAVALDFSCEDATSGIASCSGSQAGNLDTSVPGTFVFIVTAVDQAGNTAQLSVTYSVKAAKVDTLLALSSSPNPSKPNHDVMLSAVVTPVATGGIMATGVVELRINGVLAGSAPLVNGTAIGTVKLKRGNYVLTATYSGDANFNGSTSTVLHEVR